MGFLFQILFCHGFELNKLKIIQYNFELAEENLVMSIKTRECLCLGAIGLIVTP